jgi:hypothetical protein
MLAPLVVGTGIWVWSLFAPEMRRTYSISIPITFRIVDAETQKVVTEAVIQISSRGGLDQSNAPVSAAGEAGFVFHLRGEVVRKGFVSTDSIDYTRCSIYVEAPGYKNARVRLEEYTGARRDASLGQPTRIQIELTPGTVAQDDIENIADIYHTGWRRGQEIIELCTSGAFYWWIELDTGDVLEGRGSVTYTHGVVELSVVAVSNTNSGQEWFGKLYPIRCGQRLYLVPEGKGQRFCDLVNRNFNQVLGRNETGAVDGVFLRVSDFDKAPGPVVEIPETWVKYLVRKPVAGSHGQIQKR